MNTRTWKTFLFSVEFRLCFHWLFIAAYEFSSFNQFITLICDSRFQRLTLFVPGEMLNIAQNEMCCCRSMNNLVCRLKYLWAIINLKVASFYQLLCTSYLFQMWLLTTKNIPIKFVLVLSRLGHCLPFGQSDLPPLLWIIYYSLHLPTYV